MYCKSCGEEIPENSRFCINCGDEVVVDTTNQSQSSVSVKPGEFFTSEYQEDEKTQTVAEEESERIKNNSFKFASGFFIALIVLCVWAVSTSSGEGESSNPSMAAPSVSVAQTAVSSEPSLISSEPSLSPRQQQIKKVFQKDAIWQFEDTIKQLLKNPSTAQFTHDEASWIADNAILTGGGTVTYKNAKDQTVSEPFRVSIIMNDESFFPLYIELNKVISTNILDQVDNKGLATKLGTQGFGVSEGRSIFKQNSSQIVSIMYEEGKQLTPSKPTAPSSPSRAKPSKEHDDYSEWIGFSTSDLQTLLNYMASGDVVCIDGQYYCSPRLANQKEVIVYTYDAASDPNYPRN